MISCQDLKLILNFMKFLNVMSKDFILNPLQLFENKDILAEMTSNQ